MSKPRWKMKETHGSPAPKLKKWRGSPAPKIYAKVTISKAMNVQMENDKGRNNTNNDKTQKTTDKKTNKNKKRTAWKGFKQIHQDRLLDCLLYAKGLSPGHEMGSHFLETFLLGCSLLCAFALPKDVDFTWFQWKKNCHQDSAGEAFDFSWTNNLCLGAWLRFRYWTAFNPMFFRPSWKLRLDLLG